MKLFIIVATVIGILSSCHNSPQKKYYVLTPELVAPQNLHSSSVNITNVIGIGPIEIPDYLHRLPIAATTTSDKQSGNTVSLSDTAYWAEPLDKGIARVIGLNLTYTNSRRGFIYFPWRSDVKPRYSLRIYISNLTCTHNEASILADWALVDNNTLANAQANTHRRRFSRALPVSGGAQELTRAYSKLFAELSIEMDKALQELAF